MALDSLECGWRWRKDKSARKANAGADFEHVNAPLWIALDSPSCGRPLRQRYNPKWLTLIGVFSWPVR
jgi:hypothetical protein